jgi:hypothetical protein
MEKKREKTVRVVLDPDTIREEERRKKNKIESRRGINYTTVHGSELFQLPTSHFTLQPVT